MRFVQRLVERDGPRVHEHCIVGEHMDGTHCELIALPAAQVHALDERLSWEEAAAFPLVYETAYRMLVTRAGLREGETVLVWGIGGGVATAAFEIARALGARTIVTSGSGEKLERARGWGADLALNHHDDDVAACRLEGAYAAVQLGGALGVNYVSEIIDRRRQGRRRLLGGREPSRQERDGQREQDAKPNVTRRRIDPARGAWVHRVLHESTYRQIRSLAAM